MEKKVDNVRAVIFDLDGTLIDTEKIYREIWPRAIGDMGYVMTDDQYLSLRSLGRPFAPQRMREWYGPDFDYDRARAIRKVYFDERIARDGIDLKPGVWKLLDFLKEKGITAAIATATDPVRAEQYLKMTGLAGAFDRVISATEVKEGKPKPYVYQYACSQLGLKPEECLAVEDAPNGIRSAYDAGLKVIMVPDQTGPDEELMPMLTGCVESLDRICGLLE